MYSVRTPQLAKDRRQSCLDRSLPDIQPSRYFLIGGALGHHTGNLALSGRQHGEAAPFGGRHGPPDDQSKLGNETGQHLASRPNLTAVDLLDRFSEELGSDSCAAVPARIGLEYRQCLALVRSVGKDKDCRVGARLLDRPHISRTPKLRQRKVEEKDVGLERAHSTGQRIAVGFLMDGTHVLERPAPPRSDRRLGAHEQNSRTISTTSTMSWSRASSEPGLGRGLPLHLYDLGTGLLRQVLPGDEGHDVRPGAIPSPRGAATRLENESDAAANATIHCRMARLSMRGRPSACALKRFARLALHRELRWYRLTARPCGYRALQSFDAL